MKHLVLKPFINEGSYLISGSHFESKDAKQVAHLAKHGHIKPNEKFKEAKKEEVKKPKTPEKGE